MFATYANRAAALIRTKAEKDKAKREIALRLEQREMQLKAETDYKALASNDTERRIKMDAILINDSEWMGLRIALHEAEAALIDATAELEAHNAQFQGARWQLRQRMYDALILAGTHPENDGLDEAVQSEFYRLANINPVPHPHRDGRRAMVEDTERFFDEFFGDREPIPF